MPKICGHIREGGLCWEWPLWEGPLYCISIYNIQIGQVCIYSTTHATKEYKRCNACFPSNFDFTDFFKQDVTIQIYGRSPVRTIVLAMVLCHVCLTLRGAVVRCSQWFSMNGIISWNKKNGIMHDINTMQDYIVMHMLSIFTVNNRIEFKSSEKI